MLSYSSQEYQVKNSNLNSFVINYNFPIGPYYTRVIEKDNSKYKDDCVVKDTLTFKNKNKFSYASWKIKKTTPFSNKRIKNLIKEGNYQMSKISKN